MATEAAVAVDWSSLPADLVNRVADRFRDTNDLDYHMHLRAVCHNWRAATADPKTSRDARLRPTRWIVLDEAADGDARLFVHAVTGRFVRRRLPPLRDHHLVTSTTGGLFVLAGREPPHAARVVNPFTGSVICFKAPVPSKLSMTAAILGDLPTLILACRSSNEFSFFLANPHSEHFVLEKSSCPDPYNSLEDIQTSLELWSSSLKSHDDGDADTAEASGLTRSCMLLLSRVGVELAASGEMLLVDRSPEVGVHVYKMGPERMERVSSIGRHALFIGFDRCLSIHADSFPGVDADCVYYLKYEDDFFCSGYMYDLVNDKEVRIGDSIILRLINKYTMQSPTYKPANDRVMEEINALNRSFMELALDPNGLAWNPSIATALEEMDDM